MQNASFIILGIRFVFSVFVFPFWFLICNFDV
jgi:hypothetical protein